MKELILLRHGKTSANDTRLYCGATDIPLSENGIADLQKKKSDFLYPDIAGFSVFTSGMKRTEQTLIELYGDVPHTVFKEFEEMNFGVFEMRAVSELEKDPQYRAWMSGDYMENLAPGGETGNAMAKRVTDKLSELLSQNEHMVLITHGGPIVAIMEKLFPGQKDFRFAWQPKNGEGYQISFENGRPVSYTALPLLLMKNK